MPRYAAPGRSGSVVSFRDRYDHFIGGDYVPPARGNYFENPTPVTGAVFTEVARGTAEDVEHALDAAHGAARAWARTSVAERANVLNEIADRIEDNLEALAVAESWDSGKPVREVLAADLPLAIDHFRYFAGVIRAQEGRVSQIDNDLVAYHFQEPLGVVAQLVPWHCPLLMATWQLAPALAAGNSVVLKPAEQTPASIHVLVDAIADLLPPGVLNVVNGFGVEVGTPLAGNRRVAKVVATEEIAGSGLIVFGDVAAQRDAFHGKALDGIEMFALHQGGVQALLQHSGYDELLAAASERVAAMRVGDPLDTGTTVGAQTSEGHVRKALAYVDEARRQGARLVAGGERVDPGGELSGGYYVMPTILEGDHRMRVLQEGAVGPVLSVAGFADFADAVKATNDGARPLDVGVWSRDGGAACRAGRLVQARRVWVNNHHAHPAHAAFGRENRRTMLDHYQQTKDLLVSDP